MFEIRFEPDGNKIHISEPMTLLEAAERAGIIINAVCGGAGTCNKCMVEVEGRLVRACQTRADRDMIVTIPDTSRFFEQKILQEGIDNLDRIDPLVCKHYVNITEPTLDNLRSDADRLIDAVNDNSQAQHHTCHNHAGTSSGTTTITWQLLKKLPSIYRNHSYALTTVCHDGSVFALEPGDTTQNLHGVAVDVGTTTVVASLINLQTGKTIAIASQTNPQVTFGDDVISRIDYSAQNPDGLEQLQRRIINGLNQLIANLCEKSVIKPWQIYELTAAGNATMQHILLGLPVEQIAQAPYVSAVSSAVNVPAASLGLDIHPEANVYVMPSVAAHVGGDTVAVGLATAMRHSSQINLALDIGTNGELILGNSQRLLTCSTAAGPAFEGARIAQGIRGAAGAIERVHIEDGQVHITVIGGVPPTGICGSGLIDALAELLNVGIIADTGRMLDLDELPANIPQSLKERLIKHDDKPAFVLATAEQSKHNQEVLLTQRDVREAQLAKAAIAAGITTLMNEFGITLNQVDNLYLAGAFGNYIRPESARRIGLIPNLPLEKIQFVGNAASTGAKQALLSRQARKHAEELGKFLEYIELAGRTDFQNIFSEQMMF